MNVMRQIHLVSHLAYFEASYHICSYMPLLFDYIIFRRHAVCGHEAYGGGGGRWWCYIEREEMKSRGGWGDER